MITQPAPVPPTTLCPLPRHSVRVSAAMVLPARRFNSSCHQSKSARVIKPFVYYFVVVSPLSKNSTLFLAYRTLLLAALRFNFLAQISAELRPVPIAYHNLGEYETCNKSFKRTEASKVSARPWRGRGHCCCCCACVPPQRSCYGALNTTKSFRYPTKLFACPQDGTRLRSAASQRLYHECSSLMVC